MRYERELWALSHSPGTGVKLLALVQRFHQGWGGGPESIRLLARVLGKAGVSVDVYDRGKVRRAVEALDLLPEAGTPAESFDCRSVPAYDAILIAGPWQDPRALRPILSARRARQPLIYLPRGGLGHIEFRRAKDLKKWPYFYVFERRLIDASSAIVFSSECEKRHTITAARHRSREAVIPDFFDAVPPPPDVGDSATGEMRFGFMAEISPRKGLLPLIEGFVEFASDLGAGERLRLIVGGSVRRHCEAYFGRIRAAAAATPQHAPIDFVGPVPHRDRARFYENIDAFLVPSLFESFGLTVLEGLGAGCAEVTGPRLGVLEFLPAEIMPTIAEDVSSAAIAAALRAQFEAVREEPRSARTARVERAQTAIASINSLARDRWLQLLGG